MNSKNSSPPVGQEWDHSSRDEFYDYYATQSLTDKTLQRFLSIRETVLRVLGPEKSRQRLQVADVGCGAGTQSFLWAELGHQVFGLDINQRLIDLARERVVSKSVDIDFSVGSANALPWPERSMDVCLVPELLEHVVDWERCLDEFVRVLKIGGVLFLTTTNKLCPKQEEFNLPLYPWYPGFVKRRYEKLAMTTRPELANHATYPAVHWFSFYSLDRALRARGCECMDKFATTRADSTGKAWALKLIRALPPLRFLAHVATSYTQIIAIKRL